MSMPGKREQASDAESMIEAKRTDPEPTLPGAEASDAAEHASTWDTQPMALLDDAGPAVEFETARRYGPVAVATGDIIAEQLGGDAEPVPEALSPQSPDAPIETEDEDATRGVPIVAAEPAAADPPPLLEEWPGPAALDALERTYRAAGRSEALVEPLIGWAEAASAPAERIALLERLARLYAELGRA
ncbi:MAG: hypothetical protein IPL40_16575 [Proteobacteria bacterium]|nr:hypothetical protein [Pseudomonadota bacterium]